ncbi:uncharacterized protein LOC113035358, partial [Tachysurus ichikawai]
MFNLTPGDQSTSHHEYVKNWRKRMNQDYWLASEASKVEGVKAKSRYDNKTYGAELQPGCRVLIRNIMERGGPGKLSSYWEEHVHVVQKKRLECQVYDVHSETGQGQVRVLHRNMLFLCEFLPVEDAKVIQKKAVKLKKSKHNTKQQARECSSQDESDWMGVTDMMMAYRVWQ